MKKFYNMEFGTYKENYDKIQLEIEKSRFKTQEPSELEEIEYADERFFNVSISENENSFKFDFQLEEGFKNLKTIVSENLPIKLEIAKTILKQNILETSGFDFVSINPSSIYFLPMRQVKYLYRANYLMPVDAKHDSFSQYKACILYILTGQNYESLLEGYSSLDKLVKSNPYLEQIIETKNLQQLLNIIDRTENLSTYSAWEKVKSNEGRFKKLGITFVTALVLTNLLTGLTINKIKNRQKEVAIAKVKRDYQSSKLQNQIDSALSNENYDKAIKLLKKNSKSDKDIAKIMFENKQYQLALNYDSSLLEKVIAKYWAENKQDSIIDLKLSSNSKKSLSNKLELEQAIVAYQTDKMQSELGFTEDPNTLMRMGLKYVQENSLLNASAVNDKLKGIDASKKQYNYLKNQIDLEDAKSSLSNAQKNLEDANKLDDSDENKGNKVSQAQNDIKKYQEEVDKLEEKAKKIKKEVY
jgi:hypothetical protein